MLVRVELGNDGDMGRDSNTMGPTDDPWKQPGSVTTVSPMLIIGFAAMVFVVAVAALVMVIISGNRDSRAGGAAPSTSVPAAASSVVLPTSTAVVSAPSTTVAVRTAPPTTQVPTMTSPRITTPPISAEPLASNEAAAFTQLAGIVESDRSQAEAIVDVWVPQLSSKYAGLDVAGDGRGAYSIADVLSDHLGYAQRYQSEGLQVVLVKSDDYNFKAPGYLVTLLDLPFATGEAANEWCSSRGIGVDDCFAKRLGHGSWQGSVLSRK